MATANSLKIANQLLHGGKLDDARQEYQRLIELRPQFGWNYYYLGRLFVQQGKWQDAVSQYRQAIKLNPNSASLHNSLAEALIQHGELDEAINYSQKAISLQPDLAIYHQTLALAYEAKSDFSQALTTWQKVLSLNPSHLRATQKISWLQTDVARDCVESGDKLNNEGKIEEAVESYQQALILNPQQPMPVYLNCGNNLISLGRFEEAESVFERLIKVYPEVPDGYKGCARVANHLADWELALERWENAINKFPHYFNFHLQKGNILLNLGEFARAEVVFDGLAKQFPCKFEGKDGLARILTAIQDWENAANMWQEVIERFPQHKPAYLQLAKALTQLGKLELAETVWNCYLSGFQQAVKSHPQVASGYFHLGNALKTKSWTLLPQAIAAYRQAIKLNPRSHYFYLTLAGALRANYQLEEAEALYRQAIALNPKLVGAYTGLAGLLARIDRVEEAIALLKESISIETHPNLYSALANLIVESKGDLSEAEIYYQQAIALRPSIKRSSQYAQFLSKQNRLGEALNIYWELHTINYQRFSLTRLWKGINANPSKLDAKYVIFGTSHSVFFRQKYENLDVIVYSIPAASVAGFGKRESTLNTSNLVRHIVESQSFDKFIFKLGQVDIEAGYYYKLIMKGEELKFEDFARNIASVYFDFLTSLKVDREKLVVFGVNLPSIFLDRNAVRYVAAVITNSTIPRNNSESTDTTINRIVARVTNVLPPIVERTKRSLQFNQILKELCQEYRISYRDFTEETLDPDTGILKLDFVDKSPENCDNHFMFCPSTVKLYADKLLTL